MIDSNRKPLELSSQSVSANLLRLFVQKLSRKEYLDSVTKEIADWTGCRCVGIRILDSRGYIPYESYMGFSSHFLEKENNLSIKENECVCIRVIKGEFESPDQSAITPHGSFNCENSNLFLASLQEDQKRLFRGTCVESGFKSICVVPIRYQDEILGAIHVADEREGVIPSNAVEIFESTAHLIGEAVFRYRLEQALKKSENQYRIIVENSPSGIYLVNDGKIIFANKAFADIHGYSVDEVRGIESLKIIHPDDRRRVEEIRQKKLKEEEGLAEYEVRGLKKNGDTIWVQRRSVLIDFDGKPSILGYVIDITERRKSELILHENREFLETIFANVHFLIAYMDKDFNFIRVNRAYAEADGHTPDFYVGKNHFALFPDAENENIFRKVLETGEPYFVSGKPFEYPLNPERGTTYWDWSLRPIKDTDGLISGLVLSLVNVTDSKRAEEALKQANIELKQKTIELSQRAAQLTRLSSELTLAEHRERHRIAEILHDDVQQLMVGAKMGQEMLIRQIDGKLAQAATKVHDQIAQAINISRSLTVDLSPPALLSGNLSVALEWLARWMRENQGFEVKLQTETQITQDRIDLTVLLYQSIRELLLNTLKHAGVKSATIRIEKMNRVLRIDVSDRGVGFDPDTVWDFAGSEQKFGLISIHERLQLLGGHIEIDSALNKGATISLIVPLHGERPAEKEMRHLSGVTFEKSEAELSLAGIFSGKIRVMVVDDHPVVREGLCRMLDFHSDIEVVAEASDGEKAVHLAREIVPDVILMDISMPNMNGLEATRIIHSEFPHIRIIGLSMYEGDERAVAMIDAGASAYRSKSEKSDLLLAVIRGRD